LKACPREASRDNGVPEHLAHLGLASPRRVPGTQALGPCTLGEAASWAIL